MSVARALEFFCVEAHDADATGIPAGTPEGVPTKLSVIERHARTAARYALEIRGVSLHAEAHELAHIAALLHGHAGRAHVIDRNSGLLVLEGTVDDVRKALASAVAPSGDNARPGVE